MKLIKADSAESATELTSLPNIGPALSRDLRSVGIDTPRQLRGQDAFALYQSLNRIKAKRQDPCVLDTFIAAVDFMNGAAARPWWHYTAERKAEHPDL